MMLLIKSLDNWVKQHLSDFNINHLQVEMYC